MADDYTELVPFFSDFDMIPYSGDEVDDPDLQPNESAIRNLLQYAAGLFVFRDQDDKSQFLIMN